MAKINKNTIFTPMAYDFGNMLDKVRDEIIERCAFIIKNILGGRVCVRYYHSEEDLDRYTFFECDGDGYGRELFLDTIFTDGEGRIEILLHDSEDSYNPYWELSDFNASNALYLLEELENIVDFLDENDEDIVTDWEPDMD